MRCRAGDAGARGTPAVPAGNAENGDLAPSRGEAPRREAAGGPPAAAGLTERSSRGFSFGFCAGPGQAELSRSAPLRSAPLAAGPAGLGRRPPSARSPGGRRKLHLGGATEMASAGGGGGRGGEGSRAGAAGGGGSPRGSAGARREFRGRAGALP